MDFSKIRGAHLETKSSEKKAATRRERGGRSKMFVVLLSHKVYTKFSRDWICCHELDHRGFVELKKINNLPIYSNFFHHYENALSRR
jgi:hypothetical protein